MEVKREGETIGEGRRLGRAGEREKERREREREVVSDSGFSTHKSQLNIKFTNFQSSICFAENAIMLSKCVSLYTLWAL